MAPRGTSTRSSMIFERKTSEELSSASRANGIPEVASKPSSRARTPKTNTGSLAQKRKITRNSPKDRKVRKNLDRNKERPRSTKSRKQKTSTRSKRGAKVGLVTPADGPKNEKSRRADSGNDSKTKIQKISPAENNTEEKSDSETASLIDDVDETYSPTNSEIDGSPSHDRYSDSRLNLDGDDDDDRLTVDTDDDRCDTDTKEKKIVAPDDADKHLIDVSDNNESGKRFKCSFCGKTSQCRADLKKHIRVHTGVRPHKCKVCNASFIQITALRGHETIHTGQKPFACDVCDKTFAIKDRLRLHMRVHTGEKPYKCPQCNMTFARRSQIVQHAKIHSTDRCYRCEECSQTFTTYHMLQAHHNTHRGIKEFMCVACGKKFMRLEGMNKHIRTVHRGSRPYTCNICGKSFKGHLQQHMRLHMGVRPFECNICKATFTQNSQLTVHMRIHTGDRPYKCQICGANFAHSSACKIHMRSHTGEKPFRCVLCDTSFAQLPHLKKHMRCVHDAEKPYLCTGCCDFFQTQQELDMHKQLYHGIKKTNEEEAEQTVEEATLARLRARLAVLLYRISSEERRAKFGFGKRIIDDVLKTSLKSSGHEPITDPEMSTLNELRQNVLLLLKWTIPIETMEEYHRNSMTVDEVLEMLTS
ncbi:hypothetical protein HAZT_HAZT002731 [Hyalella azteca]|nr:hypothetical protein HAZT_HAZT002731 [Hyalella azteca]